MEFLPTRKRRDRRRGKYGGINSTIFFKKSVDKSEKVCYNISRKQGRKPPGKVATMKYWDIENMADYEEEMAEIMREIAEEEEKGE